MKSINSLKAKFVIIEFNQYIPFDVEYEDTTEQFIGNSALAIYKYAISQNYDLIGATLSNLIFIDKSFSNERIEKIDISNLYQKVKPVRLAHTWKGEMIFFKLRFCSMFFFVETILLHARNTYHIHVLFKVTCIFILITQCGFY